MPTNKLERFRQMEEFGNVTQLTDFQDSKVTKPKGRWRRDVFGNDHPITLELACGKGEYTLALSEKFPQRNFIGIDIKGSRLWKGARKALKENRDNVHFLRIFIDHLDEYFAPDEVDDIWITFPDPYPKGSDRNKRLSSPKFLDIYRNVLKPEGTVRLKTDNRPLFDFTRRTIEKRGYQVLDAVGDIYQERPDDPLLTHQTYFEKKHLKKGRTISYIHFTLSD